MVVANVQTAAFANHMIHRGGLPGRLRARRELDIGESASRSSSDEERAVLRKEIVPDERVRLRAKRIEEDTVRDELRASHRTKATSARNDPHRDRRPAAVRLQVVQRSSLRQACLRADG